MRINSAYTGYHFYISMSDVAIAVVAVLVILVFAFFRSNSGLKKQPLYKYYLSGLWLKLFGSLAFAMYYANYLDGGDTVSYWYGAEALKNLFYQNPSLYFQELFGETNWTTYYNRYNENTGWPLTSIYRSARHFNTCRIASLVAIVVPFSFLGQTFAMGFLAYHATFKLYITFVRNFPHLEKQLRLGILYIPSVLFWCSGIMKDTIVLMGVCNIVYETDRFLSRTENKKRLRFFIRIIFWGWLIFLVKPYVVIAMAPAWLAWMNYETIKRIQSPVLKYYLLPFVVIGTFTLAFYLYVNSSGKGEFAADNIMEKALVSRNDFATNVTYGKNRARVEVIDNPTSDNILRAVPESIIMGLFRPFVWEARSPAIFMSALENFFLLAYFILALFKLKLFGLLGFIRSHPLLLFSVLFSIVLAFVVGFTTPLFGAMVRFRTPFLPFWVAFMIVAIYHIRSLPKVRYK